MTQRQLDGHRRQMDGLRFLAFLGVFIYHAFGENFRAGFLGVQIFFALSGFLITRILLLNESGSLAHDLGVFYARRVLRIFPLYYGVLVYLLVRGQLSYPVWQFLYAQNFLSFSQETLVSPLHFWTLCVEEQFYLTYPLILALIPRSLRLQGILALIAASAATSVLLDYLYPTNPLNFVLLPAAAQFLLWGGLVGLLDLSDAAKKLSATASLATGAALFLVPFTLYVANVDRLPVVMPFVNVSIGVSLGLVIFGLWRTTSKPVIRLFSFAPVAYLGKISYGLYVYHWFSFHWTNRLLSLPVPGLGFLRYVHPAVPSLLLTVALAALSWHLYESPINNLKRFFPYRRRGSAGPATHPMPVAARPAWTSSTSETRAAAGPEEV